jgi:hypothetical protein
MNRRSACRTLAFLPLAVALRAAAHPAAPFRVAWVSLEQAGSNSTLFAAFRAGMANPGYVEGKNLSIDA